MNKLFIVALSSLILGGCTLADQLTANHEAAMDQNSPAPTPAVSVVASPSPDPELMAEPSPGSGTDTTSIETDLNNTKILDEDFSDLN